MKTTWIQLLSVAAIAMLSVDAQSFAATIYMRDVNSAFGGNAVTVSEWDDAYIATGGSASTNGGVNNGSALQMATLSTGVTWYSLVGIKDLFTQLPATNGSGDPLTITNAQLHLYSNSSFPGSAGATVTVNRVTTDWLSQTAGDNDATVSGTFAKNSAPTVSWAGATFGAGDYSAVTSGSVSWNAGANALNSIDITNVVNAMYAVGTNHGFVLRSNATALLQARSTDQTANITPVLEITYSYAVVPEPTTMGMVALAGVTMLARGRR